MGGHWPALIGTGVALAAAAASLFAIHLITPARLPHAPAGLVTLIRRTLAALVLLVGGFAVLELLRVVQLPDWAGLLLPSILFLMLGPTLANIVTPLVPGVLLATFHRVRIGQYIVVGNSLPPIGEGWVVERDYLAIHLKNGAAKQSIPCVVIANQPVTILPGPPARPDDVATPPPVPAPTPAKEATHGILRRLHKSTDPGSSPVDRPVRTSASVSPAAAPVRPDPDTGSARHTG